MKHVKCYKKDYPRPQMVRDNFELLNGEWDFIYERENVNDSLKNGFTSKGKILVPFTYETKLSGINVQKQFDEVWYSKTINVDKSQLTDVVMLHFEGVDYQTTVFVNGKQVGENKGGYHRFSMDIRSALKVGENTIAVKVCDSLDFSTVRGKQRWHDQNFFCFYVQTTGIWKSVWLEFLNETYLKEVKTTPDLSDDSVTFDLEFSNANADADCFITVSFDGQIVQSLSVNCLNKYNSVKVVLTSNDALFVSNYWTIEKPNLYDVEFNIVEKGKTVDKVGSYFGLREFKAEGNKLLLNKVPVYLKLVLDQGYFLESGLTAPSEEALKEDILIAQKMGFNGARKHQKIEDERYLYYADILGFLVWCEMPSAYLFGDNMASDLLCEWHKIVRQNYNHPSVCVWVGLNESWGVKNIYDNQNMQAFANAVYYQTKSIDSMRPVVSNDGWEHAITDILTLHNYEPDGDKYFELYDTFEKLTQGDCKTIQKQPFAKGYGYNGQPIMISEFGGIVFEKDNVDGAFGYGNGAKDEKEFLSRFDKLCQAIKKMPSVCGFCYTQLTDVEQEVNGIVDNLRSPKVSLKGIKQTLDK